MEELVQYDTTSDHMLTRGFRSFSWCRNSLGAIIEVEPKQTYYYHDHYNLNCGNQSVSTPFPCHFSLPTFLSLLTTSLLPKPFFPFPGLHPLRPSQLPILHSSPSPLSPIKTVHFPTDDDVVVSCHGGLIRSSHLGVCHAPYHKDDDGGTTGLLHHTSWGTHTSGSGLATTRFPLLGNPVPTLTHTTIMPDTHLVRVHTSNKLHQHAVIIVYGRLCSS